MTKAQYREQHMTSIPKRQPMTSSYHKIFKQKKIFNFLYFPPTLPHSTHIVLWRRTGKPTHDLSHQERQFRPSQNIQTKKILNRLYFPPTLPHTTHILCGAGPENQHMTLFTKSDNTGSQNIQTKKHIKSFIFPTYPTLKPHPHFCSLGPEKPNT
ncbi:hypothetical protein TNCV_1980101 [Trichonephila clavipes]|nr:hypothetical protein TNCV_1980101 [Trichonephila clavipes]